MPPVVSLSTLLADIEVLQMDFPVATIAARTGVDKGNVSAYLKGRKPLGKTFISQFYKAFEEAIRQAKNSASRTTPLVSSRDSFSTNTDALITDNVKTIERINRGLSRLEILARKVLHHHKENSILFEKLRRELNIPNDSPNQ